MHLRPPLGCCVSSQLKWRIVNEILYLCLQLCFYCCFNASVQSKICEVLVFQGTEELDWAANCLDLDPVRLFWVRNCRQVPKPSRKPSRNAGGCCSCMLTPIFLERAEILLIQLPSDINSCTGRKNCWTGQERSLRDCKAQGKDSRGREGKREEMGVEVGTLSRGRHRQLSHISGLIGTDKVLLEDSVPTALFALESQGPIYYDWKTLERSEVGTAQGARHVCLHTGKRNFRRLGWRYIRPDLTFYAVRKKDLKVRCWKR